MKNQASWTRQFIVFFGVGAVATAVHYCLMIALADGLKVDPVLAAAVGYTAGAVVNYLLNYHYTFASKGKHRDTVAKFAVVALSGLALNVLLVGVMVKSMGLHYLLAQAIATGLILGWNFVLNKMWTFKR